ncbi:MAG: hypothetical protein AB1921_01420 [Thermodesulfobacteriota bacterium]
MALKDRLISLRKERELQQIDWEKRRDAWIVDIIKLYEDIGGWFSELFEEGFLKIKFRKKTLSEDYIGKYSVDCMELDLEVYPTVVLEPVGRNIIGYAGRIDVYIKGHESDKMMLFLVDDEDKKKYWELAKTSYNKKEKVRFNRKSFEKLLEYWLDAWS